MEPIFVKEFSLTALHTDCLGRLKASALLQLVQEAAGEHCALLQVDLGKDLMWAIVRHRLQVTRWPEKGETIRLETWPMPTTRTAYPRSVVAYDGAGQEIFRSIALWVLMDRKTRALVLPKNSGVALSGILRGTELSVPGALVPSVLQDTRTRQVCFGDLDENGHMNNARYLDWLWDLLPSGFHRQRSVRELTLCYLSEALEGQTLTVQWAMRGNQLQADIFRQENGQMQRIFSALAEY